MLDHINTRYILIRSLFVCGILASAGCGAMHPVYIPKQVGAVNHQSAYGEVNVELSCPVKEVRKGTEVPLEIRIQNRADTILHVPRRPHILVTWTYPDGSRDSLLADPPGVKFFQERDVLVLQPGQSALVRSSVSTEYFMHSGLTEFSARVTAPENTNPTLASLWQGEAVSNGYGIMVRKGGRGSYSVANY